MKTTFAVWICFFFKEYAGIDLNNYRDDETRNYDSSSLLFLNWNLVPLPKRETIQKFAKRHHKKFMINTITAGLRCISEVYGNRRS